VATVAPASDTTRHEDDVVRPVLMKGNEAMAEAAIQAGCDAYFGYPITPQAELLEWMARRMPELGRVFVQAESELAAINMALGAAATGARVLVSSSSPGISLMAEGMSYLAGSEVPMVLIDVMRGGPGLGSIGPSQSDYFQATKGHGHGDYRVPVLAPSSIAEAVGLVADAFEIAERYRTPVMILADGVMGQAMEPVLPVYRMPVRTPGGWELSGAVDRLPRVVRSLHLRPEDLEAGVPDAIREAAEQVITRTEVPFNSVGLNLYRDGRDSVAPHNDHLNVLVEGHPIALLSLGGTRRMTIRAKEPPRRAFHVDLEAGSLLTMSYETQLHYTHGVPKTNESVGSRISLAFRVRPGAVLPLRP